MIDRRTARIVAPVILAVGATACSGSSAPRTTPSTTPPVASTPASGVQQLQQLASLGARLTYAATYRAHLRSPASTATWRVWRSRTELRVDVVAKRVVATLIITPRGSFSCRLGRAGRACFRVARAGAPIPAPFDYAPHAVFSTDINALARNAGHYDVAAAGHRPAAAGVPASACFTVATTPTTPKPLAHAGTYCLSDRGLLTAVTYPSGDTIRLTRATLRTPPASRFVPYAPPTPVG